MNSAVYVALRVTKMNLVKKSMVILAEIADENDDYGMSYVQFVKCLKFGVHDDFSVEHRWTSVVWTVGCKRCLLQLSFAIGVAKLQFLLVERPRRSFDLDVGAGDQDIMSWSAVGAGGRHAFDVLDGYSLGVY